MARRQSSWFRVALLAIAATAILVLLFSLLQHHFDGESDLDRFPLSAQAHNSVKGKMREKYIPISERTARIISPEDHRIYGGIKIDNIYSLSLKDRVFMAEGLYWLRWPEAINTILEENDIGQEKIIEFTNLVEASSMVVEPAQPNPKKLANGYYLQQFKFSGKFYIESLDLYAFPFDILSIPIVMEPQPEVLSCDSDGAYGCTSLVRDPDATGSMLGNYVSVNGYNIIAAESNEFTHKYNTNFGQGAATQFSSISFDVIYRTAFFSAFWSYLFPLLILVSIVIMSPSLPGALGDVRLAIPTTILLTLIFLQIGYKSELPALTYVTYLDWLYIYAYLVSAALFILFCWGTNMYSNASTHGQEEAVLRRINRVDLLVQVAAFLGLVSVLVSGLTFNP